MRNKSVMLYSASEAFHCFADSMSPESTVKQWAFYLLGHYCAQPRNDRTLAGIERFFCLDTHYNRAPLRDNPAREKTCAVYRFISSGTDLLLSEMVALQLLLCERCSALL